MSQNQEPNWQPIRALPMIAALIDETLAAAEELRACLEEAQPKPHVLDDATVQRMIASYTTQAEDLWLFDEQLIRWERLSLAAWQQREVERLKGQMERLRVAVRAILTLAGELKKGTIDSVLSKSDIEVGLDFLSGQWKR